MRFINFIVENWAAMLAAIAVIIGGVLAVRKFLLLPSGKQIEKIIQWLLWAVAEAERTLGGGTGVLKLSRVYDKFVRTFPWLARIVSIDLFNGLVDHSLDVVRGLIKDSLDMASVVETERM